MNGAEWMAWLLLGLFSGWVAKQTLMKKWDLLLLIIVSVIGGFIGGFAFHGLLNPLKPTPGFHLESVFTAYLGTLTLLALLRFFGGKPVATKK